MKFVYLLSFLGMFLCSAGSYARGVRNFTPEEASSSGAGEAVELGLSVKWASCNIGASAPEEYGDYFAWGETKPKSCYDWNTYFVSASGGSLLLEKYNNRGGKKLLEPEDDAATANWGGTWRMPTYAELRELLTKCTWTLTVQKGTRGYRVSSRTNGNSIFLPAAGGWWGDALDGAGTYGCCWSSSLEEHGENFAYGMYFLGGIRYWDSYAYRPFFGRSVRAVCP